jgi:hypothetical protein
MYAVLQPSTRTYAVSPCSPACCCCDFAPPVRSCFQASHLISCCIVVVAASILTVLPHILSYLRSHCRPFGSTISPIAIGTNLRYCKFQRLVGTPLLRQACGSTALHPSRRRVGRTTYRSTKTPHHRHSHCARFQQQPFNRYS